MPCSRHSSGTGVPASACLSTAMIWLSVKRDFFMGTSSGNRTRKFHFWRQLTCGGITNRRLKNLLERGLVVRKSALYSVSEQGLAYLGRAGGDEPTDTEEQQDLWTLARRQ